MNLQQEFDEAHIRQHKRRAQDNCLPAFATLCGIAYVVVFILIMFWRYL